MSTTEVTDVELLDDVDESPSTDPEVRISVQPGVDNLEDDLEKRLAWLAEEVRSTSAEHAKKKREGSVLEAREYKTALVPASAQSPQDIDLPKVTLAVGVDPQRDPTLVGRRMSEIEWEFDVSDPEELSRTLPLDPHAAVADPLPFHPPARAKPPARHRTFVVAFGVLMGIFVGAFLHQSLARSSRESAYANIPAMNRGVRKAAQDAETRYRNWETVRGLLAPIATGDLHDEDSPAVPTSSASSTASVRPAPGPNLFHWVKPIPSASPKSAGSARTIAPAQEKPRLPIFTDTMGF